MVSDTYKKIQMWQPNVAPNTYWTPYSSGDAGTFQAHEAQVKRPVEHNPYTTAVPVSNPYEEEKKQHKPDESVVP